MKKITTIALSIMLTGLAYGQISTTKPVVKQIAETPYDSTKNFLGMDAPKYSGQMFYANEVHESLRKNGFRNFVTDYTSSQWITDERGMRRDNTRNYFYKYCSTTRGTEYDAIAGKYFDVLEVIKHPKAEQDNYAFGTKFFLKLQEKESNDILYFEYDAQYELFFPFIVVGFFEKQKSTFVGSEYVFADGVVSGRKDIQTGNEITAKTGQKWKCTDITIDENRYEISLIFENSHNEKTMIPLKRMFENFGIYTPIEAENYTKKFGKGNFDRILQEKVQIGMTSEMCKLSWGIPKDINETITAGKRSEQWVYSNGYLYFDNGILRAIQ